MTETLANLAQCVGTKETTTDVISASAIERMAAKLGIANPASNEVDPIPPGWHGAFFPPCYRPSAMREDGQGFRGGYHARGSASTAPAWWRAGHLS